MSSYKVFILSIVLFIVGILFLPEVPVRYLPVDLSQQITITSGFPNASAAYIEQNITTNIESAANLLEGVTEVTSNSFTGGCEVQVKFEPDMDMELLKLELSTRLKSLYQELPIGTMYPLVNVGEVDLNNSSAAYEFAIYGDVSNAKLVEYVEHFVKPALRNDNSISEVSYFGSVDPNYTINIDSEKLRGFQLTIEEVKAQLLSKFANINVGTAAEQNQSYQYSIQTQDELDWKIPLKMHEGRIVYLTDLATIKLEENKEQPTFRLNGFKAIKVSIFSEESSSSIPLCKKLNGLLEELQAKNSPINVSKIEDTSAKILLEIDRIVWRVISSVLLVFLVVLMISRKLSYLLILLISLSLNLSYSFLFYYLFGIELNMYSIAGITITIGMIIDNSILVIDHHRMQLTSSSRIPVLASTLTTIGAVAVVYFLNDMNSFYYLIDFIGVIVVNLLLSIFIALYFVPVLLKRVNLTHKKKVEKKIKRSFIDLYAQFILSLKKLVWFVVLCIILLFGLPFHRLPEEMEGDGKFAEYYNDTFGSDYYNEELREVVDRYLGGTFRLFDLFVTKNDIDNAETPNSITVSFEKKSGAFSADIDHMLAACETVIQEHHCVENFNAEVNGSRSAKITIRIKESAINSLAPVELRKELLQTAVDFGSADWNIVGFGDAYSNTTGGADFTSFLVLARGYDITSLNRWCREFEDRIGEDHNVMNLKYLNGTEEEASFTRTLRIDDEYNVLNKNSRQNVFELFQSYNSPILDGLNINHENREIETHLSIDAGRDDFHTLTSKQIDTLGGLISLDNIVMVDSSSNAAVIKKINQEYVNLISYEYHGNARIGKERLVALLKQFKKELPPGFKFQRSNRTFSVESDGEMDYSSTLLLVIFIIFAICSIFFGNFRQPLIILILIPFSFIGVFLAFYLFGLNFESGGMASFLLLMGISVNTGIYLINEFNQLKKSNRNLTELDCFIEAVRLKFYPIILTTFSTIIGFLPFVLEGESAGFWFTLGLGSIAGLFFSLFGLFIILPIFLIKKQRKSKITKVA